jgi:hypothetical protein
MLCVFSKILYRSRSVDCYSSFSDELFFLANRQYDKFQSRRRDHLLFKRFFLRMFNQRKLGQLVCTESATFFSYELITVSSLAILLSRKMRPC